MVLIRDCRRTSALCTRFIRAAAVTKDRNRFTGTWLQAKRIPSVFGPLQRLVGNFLHPGLLGLLGAGLGGNILWRALGEMPGNRNLRLSSSAPTYSLS